MLRRRTVKISNPRRLKCADFFSSSSLFLLGAESALLPANENLLDGSLEVSFNIPASKVNGMATIPIEEEQTIHLDKGRWNFLHVTQKEEASRGTKNSSVKNGGTSLS